MLLPAAVPAGAFPLPSELEGLLGGGGRLKSPFPLRANPDRTSAPALSIPENIKWFSLQCWQLPQVSQVSSYNGLFGVWPYIYCCSSFIFWGQLECVARQKELCFSFTALSFGAARIGVQWKEKGEKDVLSEINCHCTDIAWLWNHPVSFPLLVGTSFLCNFRSCGIAFFQYFKSLEKNTRRDLLVALNYLNNRLLI